MSENLTFYEPTETQLAKFHRINETPEWVHNTICTGCNNCAECNAAIHQWIITTQKHICTYGMTEEKFRIIMADADCEY